jgi:hypothetical protein
MKKKSEKGKFKNQQRECGNCGGTWDETLVALKANLLRMPGDGTPGLPQERIQHPLSYNLGSAELKVGKVG